MPIVPVSVIIISEFTDIGSYLDIELIHHVVYNPEGSRIYIKTYLSNSLNRTIRTII